MLEVFLTFLLAHLIADFPLQTNSLILLKKKGSLGIFIHVLIHLIVASFLIKDPFANWQLLLLLCSVHWIIDWTKIAMSTDSLRSFVWDQIAHLLSIILLIAVAYGVDIIPDVVLSTKVLYLAITYALLLAFMVFIWIWANHQSAETAMGNPMIGWAQRRMLGFSQRAGFALVGGVFFNLIS